MCQAIKERMLEINPQFWYNREVLFNKMWLYAYLKYEPTNLLLFFFAGVT